MDVQRPLTLAILLLCLTTSCRCSGARKAEVRWPSRVVPNAAGATRLLASPKGKYLLAEVRGAWLNEEYDHGDYVPGVLKLLGLEREVVRFGQGWALGPPDDTGRQWIIEEAPEEFRYHVRRLETRHPALALSPPEGFWHVKAALGLQAPATCMAAVLQSPVVGFNTFSKRRDRLWVASLDPETGKPLATRLVEATTPHPNGEDPFGRGIVLGGPPARPILAWLELPDHGAKDPRWRVTALDCQTLKPLWQVRLPMPPQPSPEPPKAGRHRKLTSVLKFPEPTADGERISASATLAFTGDGQHLLVLYGNRGRLSVGVRSIYALAPATGAITGQLHDKALPFVLAYRLVPVPGRAEVMALSFDRVRELMGESSSEIFFGVFEIAATPLAVRQVIDVSRAALGERWKETRYMTPHALAVLRREILLAPGSYYWVQGHGFQGKWPTVEGRGARRPEVASWVTLPRSWHRPDRAAVKAYRAWMQAATPKTH